MTRTGLALVALHFAWLGAGIGGPRAVLVFSDVLGLIIPAAPGVLCLVAARRNHGRDRLVWLFFGLGNIAWGIGNAVWALYELRGQPVPYPGLADIGYLAFIPLMAAAILTIPAMAKQSMRDRLRTALDASVVGGALVFLSWPLLLKDIYETGGSSWLEVAVNLAYPLGDIALISCVIVVAARGSDVRRHPLGLIWSGVLVTAIADFVWMHQLIKGAYVSGAVVDAAWSLGAVLIAIGAARSIDATRSESRQRVRSTRLRTLIPYAGVFIVSPALVYAEMDGSFDRFMFWTMFVFGLGLVARFFVTLGDVQRLTDDLERRVAERTAELAEANEELRLANRRQEEFVANATHELRTPLTVIGGSLESLDDLELVNAEGLRFVELARNGTRRMAQLVDDLLLASGLAIGIPFRKESFDVAGHVEIAVDAFEVKAHVQMWASGPAFARGDGERFVSAIGHLLTNADKFRAPGSPISISIDTTVDEVIVVVSNEGPPIPIELRETVFDRFRQVDASTTRQFGGLGLGLFLARELARMMKGDVRIDETVTGCRVSMTLPLDDERSIAQPIPIDRKRSAS